MPHRVLPDPGRGFSSSVPPGGAEHSLLQTLRVSQRAQDEFLPPLRLQPLLAQNVRLVSSAGAFDPGCQLSPLPCLFPPASRDVQALGFFLHGGICAWRWSRSWLFAERSRWSPSARSLPASPPAPAPSPCSAQPSPEQGAVFPSLGATSLLPTTCGALLAARGLLSPT